jgi:hypothetical protein
MTVGGQFKQEQAMGKKKKDRPFYKGDYNYPKTAYNENLKYTHEKQKLKKPKPTPEELEEILRLEEELWNS